MKATARLNELKLSKGTLVYLDKKTGKKTELKDFNLAIKDLSIGNTPGDIIKNASFTGSVDCKEVLQKDLRIENLKASVKAVKGIYNFQPLAIGSLVYFDRKAGEKTELKEINLTIKDLSLADTSGEIDKERFVHGKHGLQGGAEKEPQGRQREEFHKSGEGGILPQTPYHGYLWRKG